MPQFKANINDFRFILRDLLDIESYADKAGFENMDPSLIDPILDEAAKFCENEIFPLNETGDTVGLKFENGEVITPPGFKEAYQAYVEAGWPSMACDPEYGGQGLPEVINLPMVEMICSANFAWGLTPGLTHGAYDAIRLHGTDEQKKTYLPKLISGEWTGVMCLTEPQAGTDLGLMRTSATPDGDDSYAIEGSKIFISSGEHDKAENIIHLVLARLPDAPPGVKGISLFVVPKFIVNQDGNLGERNKFICAGIEEKMGIHASPTCVMNYDNAKGWLVGEPHKGLRAMFTMMNAARLYVGLQGLGIAEVAYQNAVAYAKDRIQGKNLKDAKDITKKSEPITVHPDVRRMLYEMKSFVEGARMMTMYTALQTTIAHYSEDEEEKKQADDFVQLITPILKSHLTDGGFETASTAMQVHGGYGYIKEYGVEQYARDARIAMIYEGTNGVQALDLVGRKMVYEFGRYLRSFFHMADAFMQENDSDEDMKEFIKPLRKHIGFLQKATLWNAQMGMINPEDPACGSVEYQKMWGIVAIGYFWATAAKRAKEILASGNFQEGIGKEFYEDKIKTARFYMKRIMPRTISLISCITGGSASVMEKNSEF